MNKLIAATSRTRQRDIHVTFSYHGYKITAGDGVVTVEERDEEDDH